MKKLILIAASLASMFLAGSCQHENLEPAQVVDTVTYTVQLPSAIVTKADYKGEVNQLIYEVHYLKGNEYVKLYQLDADIENGKVELPIEFVRDQKYKVLFWAQKKDNRVYKTSSLKEVTLQDNEYLVANSEAFEAFYGIDEVTNGNVSAKGGKVELTRAVSMINVGTLPTSLSVGEDNTVTLTTSAVTVYGLAPTFNVMEEDCGTIPNGASVSYSVQDVPSGTFSVNNTPYQYVSKNYVGFAPKDATNVTVELEIGTNAGTIRHNIPSVPVKPNYKTNIIGDLISVDADYKIELSAEWDEEEYSVEIWDGKSLSQPEFTEETKTWTVNTGAELAWMAKAVNKTLPATMSTQAGATVEVPAYDKSHKITLGDNINLGGHEWTPIGTKASHFMGEFDGAGHFIYDFKVTKHHDTAPTAHYAALFGTVSGSPSIQNLTIKKAKVVYPGEGDFYGAGLIGTAYGNVTIKNVVVKDSEISGNNKVAGILAHDGVMSSLNIENCHVEGCKIESLNIQDGGNVGGLLGLFQGVAKKEGQAAPYGDHIIKNSSVKNTVIIGINSTDTGKRSNGEFVACVAGQDNQTLVIEDCELSGNTFSQTTDGTTLVTYVSPYGEFVGGNRNDDGKGTVIVDGKEMIQAGLVKDGTEFKVENSSALEKAFVLVQDGETITILEDMSVNTTSDPNGNVVYYTGDKSFTLDLNGKTISGNTSNVVLRFQKSEGAENTITIKNGTVIAGENSWSAISIGSSCETKTNVNLIDLNIQSQKANDMAVRARAGAEFTMTNCTVSAVKGAGGIVAGGGNVTLENVTVNQKGWYSNNWNSVALGISGNGKIKVNSGSYTSDPDGNSKGTWVAYIMSSGGTLEINGGTFNGTVAETAAASNACGIICADTKAVVNINGGTFNSTGAILDMRNNTGGSPNPTALISGGTFSANPLVSGLYSSNLIKLADGCQAVDNNGVWTVSFCAVAKIGTQYYFSLNDAVAAVKDGETVTILSGTIEEGTIKLPTTLKNVTFEGEEGAILKDMTIMASDGNSFNYNGLTFDGITFDNSRISLTGWRNGDEIINNLKVTNCVFRNLDDDTNSAPVHINKEASEAVNGLTFTNNVIDGATGGQKSGIYAQVTGEVLVSGNVINNVSFRPFVIQVTTNDGIADNFVVTDNTFSGSSVGRAQGLGSDATGTDDVELIVSNNIFKDITDSQHICYWNFNPEKTAANLSQNYYDIDILANPSKIYYNSSATNVENLIAMGVFPIYTDLKSDGSIDESSLFSPVVSLGGEYYSSLEDAVKAAESGDIIKLNEDVTLSSELTLPAGITFDGNGKQINGTIWAGGDLTFAGHTKVSGFSATYYNRTITIGEGACLEVNGSGRVSLAYGNVFNIQGSVQDAKSVDKSNIQPSLIIPAGISITGDKDAVMNIKNAYVKIGSTSSKNNSANGTFTLNIEDSIAEFTDQLTFAEPTSGKNPTFNLNVKNSVLTTPKKLCVAAPNTTVVIDNSTVTLGTYLRNSGTITLKNDSVLTGATIQFGENGGNNGTINVDNSSLTINATSTGHAFDGQGVGSINLSNNAHASVTYYKAMTITNDSTSTFTGAEVK